MYQVMTALQYCWRQPWGLHREHTAWGCGPDRGELALRRRLLLSWLLSLQLTAEPGCLLHRYDSGQCVCYLSWLLSLCFHLNYPCRGGLGTIMREMLPPWISVHNKLLHRIFTSPPIRLSIHYTVHSLKRTCEDLVSYQLCQLLK